MEQFISNVLPMVLVTLVSSIIGAGFGSFITYQFEKKLRYEEIRNKQKKATIVLYHDLLSIKKYYKESRFRVNVRYNLQWQDLMTGCNIFNEKEIEFLFEFYDCIYDYNHLLEIYEKDKNNENSRTLVNRQIEKIERKLEDKKLDDIVKKLKSFR